ncbi:MAG: AAA family ATPase, partial [Actinomycetota bacterium]
MAFRAGNRSVPERELTTEERGADPCTPAKGAVMSPAKRKRPAGTERPTSDNDDPDLTSILRAMVDAGYSIVPQTTDKKGYVAWKKFQTTPADREQVEAWIDEYPNANWAIVTGEVSGVVVFEFDGREGIATMERLGLAPAILSPSGSGHVWARSPGFRVRSAPRVDESRWPGMDLLAEGHLATFYGRRGDGRYERGPGRIYSPDELPAELVALLEQRRWREPEKPTELPSGFDAFAQSGSLLQEALNRVEAGMGRRQTGFWLACQCRDERYSEKKARKILFRFVREVADLDPSRPYTESAAYASLRSAYSERPRMPRALYYGEALGTHANADSIKRVGDKLDALRIDDAAKRLFRDEQAQATFVVPPYRTTLRAELAMRTEPLGHSIEGCHREGGNTVITAEYKTGKTILALNLYKAFNDGTDFLGTFKVKRRRCAMLNYELTEEMMREWLDELDVQNQDAIAPLNLRGYRLPILTPVGEDWLVRWIEENEAEVLVVDPFSRAYHSADPTLKENDNDHQDRFFEALDVVKRRAGVR